MKTKFPVGLTCSFHWNLRFFSYCNPRSPRFKAASGQPLSHLSTPWRQWCSSTFSVKIMHRGTKLLLWGSTEIPWQRNSEWRSGLTLWSWISPFPSYNTRLVSEECEDFCPCSICTRLGLRPSSTKPQTPQIWSFLCPPCKHHGRTPRSCLWSALNGTWSMEDNQGSSVTRQVWSKACSAILLQCPGDIVPVGLHSLRTCLSPLKQP